MGSIRSSLVAFVACLLIASTTGACRSRGDEGGDADLARACDAYLASYRTCLARAGVASTAVDDRVRQTRNALLAAAAHGETDVAGRCTRGASQLDRGCR